LIRSDTSCSSDDVELGSYGTTAECGQAVIDEGYQFFTYISGGKCTAETTTSADCPEGFIFNEMYYYFF
jgi:hypothetical protein